MGRGYKDGKLVYDSPLAKQRIKGHVDILIGIPSWQGGVDPDMQSCLEHLIVHSNSIGLNIKLFKATSSIIAENRNACIDMALECDARYLFMVDTDMIFPPDILTTMKMHNKPIISAMAFMKTWPFAPNFYERLSNTKWTAIMDIPQDGSLMKVDCVGGACMMIEMAAIKNIPRPWFAQPPTWHMPLIREVKRLWDEQGVDVKEVADNIVKLYRRHGSDKQDCGPTGEDFFFCELMREYDIPIYVDTSIRIGHKGKYIYKHEDFMHQLEEKKLDEFHKGVEEMKTDIARRDKECGFDNTRPDS